MRKRTKVLFCLSTMTVLSFAFHARGQTHSQEPATRASAIPIDQLASMGYWANVIDREWRTAEPKPTKPFIVATEALAMAGRGSLASDIADFYRSNTPNTPAGTPPVPILGTNVFTAYLLGLSERQKEGLEELDRFRAKYDFAELAGNAESLFRYDMYHLARAVCGDEQGALQSIRSAPPDQRAIPLRLIANWYVSSNDRKTARDIAYEIAKFPPAEVKLKVGPKTSLIQTPAPQAATLLASLDLFDEALAVAGSDARALRDLGWHEMQSQHSDNARKATDLAIAALEKEKQPISGSDLIALAELCARLKCESAARLTAMVKAFPPSTMPSKKPLSENQFARATALAWLRQFDDAEVEFRRTLDETNALKDTNDGSKIDLSEAVTIAEAMLFHHEDRRADAIIQTAGESAATPKLVAIRLTRGDNFEETCKRLISSTPDNAGFSLQKATLWAVTHGRDESSLRDWVDNLPTSELRIFAAVGVLQGITPNRLPLLSVD